MSEKATQFQRQPLFSIVLPTRNRPESFARAVSSVARQSLKDFELIVVDDCSHTSYVDAVCSATSFQCRVLRSPSHLGAGSARNVGIEMTRGKYISFLDDDDEYSASFLECTRDRLEKTPETVGLSWCSAECVDYPKNPGEALVFRTRKFQAEYETQAALYEQLMSVGTGFGLTIKASCLKQVGLFDSALTTVEDADLFLRILSTGFTPVVVPGVHITLHNHKNLRLTNVNMHHLRIQECLQLLKQHARFLGQIPSLRRQLEHQIESLRNEMQFETL